MSTTIDSIDAWALPYREVNDHGSTRFTAMVRVRCSDGSTGWGEAATIFRGAALATAVLCRDYDDLLRGVEATPEVVLGKMRAHGWWAGGAGIDSFAVSAIDMALWNAAAARDGATLRQLLASTTGIAPRALPTLLSVHATRADLETAADELAADAARAGCIGVKVALGKAGEAALGTDPDRDIRFVSALRHAGSESMAIMIDVAPSLRWTLADVMQRARAFEELGVDWLEEPLGDRDPDGYALLRERTSLRMAYGEREWSPRGVAEIIRTGTVDVVGLDPGRVQGVTGYLESTALCAEAEVQANAHAFAGPLILDAATAASAVSPACRVMEVAPARNDLFDLVDDEHGVDDAAVIGRAI